MTHTFSPAIVNAFACPTCEATGLTKTAASYTCAACATSYPINERGQIDFRLQKPRTYSLDIELDTPIYPDKFDNQPLAMNPSPAVNWSGVDTPYHIGRTMMSHFPKATGDNQLMLDLGCGDAVHRSICEETGFHYVGLDYDTEEAPILGDGHALPFEDNSIDFILSVAVLEHIRYPQVMTREALRVLKPGGRFIGTVSFMEPFHQMSFYHHTQIGTINSLQSAGFTVDHVGPSDTWGVLNAVVGMGGLFPRMPMPLANALIWPLNTIHKLWWKLGGGNPLNRLLLTTGAFSFMATKKQE